MEPSLCTKQPIICIQSFYNICSVLLHIYSNYTMMLTLSLPITYIYVVFYIPPQPKNVNIPRIFERQRVNKLTSQFHQSDDVCHRDVTLM